MEKRKQVYKRIGTFLCLTFGLTWTVYLLIFFLNPRSGTQEYEYYVLALTWSPAIAALLTSRIYHQNLSALGLNWTATPYYLLSYLIPLVYTLPVYLVVWISGLGHFYNQATFHQLTQNLGFAHLPVPLAMAGLIVVLATFGWLNYSLTALGEEIGWRGMLVPELAKILPFWKTALISGIIWSVWHYPSILFSDYNGGTPAWYSLICFSATLIGISFPLTWLRLKSGTVWTGVIFHSSHNLFILGLFNPLTQETGITRYLISEFGSAIALTSLLVGAFFYRRSTRSS